MAVEAAAVRLLCGHADESRGVRSGEAATELGALAAFLCGDHRGGVRRCDMAPDSCLYRFMTLLQDKRSIGFESRGTVGRDNPSAEAY